MKGWRARDPYERIEMATAIYAPIAAVLIVVIVLTSVFGR